MGCKAESWVGTVAVEFTIRFVGTLKSKFRLNSKRYKNKIFLKNWKKEKAVVAGN